MNYTEQNLTASTPTAPAQPHYRVVSDGVSYKIQKREERQSSCDGWTSVCDVWIDYPHWAAGFDFPINQYASLEEAKSTCDRLNERESKRHAWEQVWP